MARRRRRQTKQDPWFAVFVVFVVVALAWSVLRAHPWLGGGVIVLVFALGGWAVYWRWWLRPRRVAAAAHARSYQLERAEAERVEHERRDLRERSATLGGLLSLTARQFELRVGEILGDHGYSNIEHVGKAGDLGVDLFVTDPSGERFAVQCKRYAPDKSVGAPEIRLLYGDITHAQVRGMCVTTSAFTADAAAYGESHGIVLIDGARLTRLVAATLPEGQEAIEPTAPGGE